MHKLLHRQLRKLERKHKEPVAILEALKLLVSQTYEEADKERRKKDRSVTLMSSELMELTRKNQEKSEAYIQAIMENVVDGIIMLNEHDQITSFNPVAEDMFGYKREEVIGKCPHFLLVESFRTIFDKALGDSKLDGGYVSNSSDHREIFMGKSQGMATFPIEFSISTINLEDELFSLLIVKDVSEQKRIEQELIYAKERAIAGAKAKSQFLSNMSHEIRTPMNAVMGLTEMLMDDNPRQDQLEILEILKFSGANLLVIINDILDFSKIEAGKIDLESIDLDLENLTTSIYTSLLGNAQEKGIEFKVNRHPEVPQFIKGDPVRLTQILTNLMSNAVKFTEKGEVSLDIHVIAETTNTCTIGFEVKDTGIGIPADKLDLIFDNFTQSNSNTTRKFGGTGLGLAISRKLIELFGGQISVESEMGIGSLFSFVLTFPKSNQKKSRTRQSQNRLLSQMQDLKGSKILLVEDNKVNQIVASKFLKKWKADFDIADNGLVACEMVQKERYDIVLMDLHMPKMDGYEATQAIRCLPEPKYQHLPIIALTASALQPIKQEVMAAGMNGFVSKPFKARELYETILTQIRQAKTNIV